MCAGPTYLTTGVVAPIHPLIMLPRLRHAVAGKRHLPGPETVSLKDNDQRGLSSQPLLALVELVVFAFLLHWFNNAGRIFGEILADHTPSRPAALTIGALDANPRPAA